MYASDYNDRCLCAKIRINQMISENLKDIREHFFSEIEKIASPEDLVLFQEKLANEIMRSERKFNAADGDEYRWHTHQLRLYGDTLAWLFLHAHTVRNLAKSSTKPPRLTSQLASFKQVLGTAYDYARRGIPVIITDVTNRIKIGDLVLCYDPEMPALHECKSKVRPEYLMQGRRGRQLSRAMQTLEYLHKGKGHVIGETGERLCVEVKTEPKYSYAFVDKAVSNALLSDSSVEVCNAADVVWAFRDGTSTDVLRGDLRNYIEQFGRPAIGCHARPLEELSVLVPPPVVWPITRESRFALMELDVFLMHFVDLSAFLHYQIGNAAITEVLEHGEFVDEYCFVIEIGNERKHLSSRFLDDVLYGHQTIESTALQMLEFCCKLEQISKEEQAILKTSKPKMTIVNSVGEALRLREKLYKDRSADGYLVMPKQVFERIMKRNRQNKSCGYNNEEIVSED